MSEKIGGAKGSTLEEDFVELERVSFFFFSGFVLKFRYRTCLPYPLFAAHAYVRANCLLSSNGSQIPVLLF